MSKLTSIPSLSGFALTGGQPGEKVKVGLSINVNDDNSTDLKFTLLRDMLDDFVYPYIIRQAQDDKIPSNFKLQMAQIVMYEDESLNEIFVNEDVRFLAQIEFNTDKSVKEGDLVYGNDINKVLGLYPMDSNADSAYVLMWRIKGDWFFACNFVYNVSKVKERLSKAKEAIKDVENSLKVKNWNKFIENLFRATELSMCAYLLAVRFRKANELIESNKVFDLYFEFSKANGLDSGLFMKLVDYINLLKHGKSETNNEIWHNSLDIYEKLKELILNVEAILKTRTYGSKTPSTFIFLGRKN